MAFFNQNKKLNINQDSDDELILSDDDNHNKNRNYNDKFNKRINNNYQKNRNNQIKNRNYNNQYNQINDNKNRYNKYSNNRTRNYNNSNYNPNYQNVTNIQQPLQSLDKRGNRKKFQNNRNQKKPGDYKNNRSYYQNNKSINNSGIGNNDMENNIIKNKLVNYIYNILDVSKFKYSLLEYETDLVQLNQNEYLVTPNYNGINCLIVFIKLRNTYYSFAIDRKSLTYNIAQIDYNLIKMIPLSIRLDESIYNGSIFDGVLLYGSNRKKTVVINDIYYFRGENLLDERMKNKMLNIKIYLESNYKEDNLLNNVNFIVNKLYDIKNIEKLINVYIPKSKYTNSIKGIVFYPQISSNKLIYLFNNCSQDNDNANNKKEIKIREVNISDDGIVLTFRMRKTNTVDVYHLYLVKKMKKNDKKIIKYKKYVMAYIPTIEVSHFCKDLFLTSNDQDILVKCKFCNIKKKWIPIEHVKDKIIPNDINDLNKYFKKE